MIIGIVGAGNIGQALARLAVAHGHRPVISNSRGPETLAALAGQIGCTTAAWQDAGPLAESWRFERAKPAYCIPLLRPGLIKALALAERDVELPHQSWRR